MRIITETPNDNLVSAVVKIAGSGIKADFIPPRDKRKIIEASDEEVFKHSDEINKEFDGLFRLLAQ